MLNPFEYNKYAFTLMAIPAWWCISFLVTTTLWGIAMFLMLEYIEFPWVFFRVACVVTTVFSFIYMLDIDDECV